MNKIILIFTFLLISISGFSQNDEYTKSERKQIKYELNEQGKLILLFLRPSINTYYPSQPLVFFP